MTITENLHTEDDPHTAPHRGAVIAATVATIALIVTILFVVVSNDEPSEASSAAPGGSADLVLSPPDLTAATTGPPAAGPNESTLPLQPAAPTITVPAPDTTPPAVPPAVAPPAVAPPVEPPPPVQPPPPSGELAVQASYELDPGVDALSVALTNQGDLALAYVIINEGSGFTADQPVGNIEPGASVDVWVDLDLASNGDGPTKFEQVVEIQSDGGDASVAISGQVEKPGSVIAEFATLPLIDYRATLQFTNVGGLPVDIVGLEATGLRFSPVPQQIAAGETLELDVAVCAGGPSLPIIIPRPQPQPNPPTFTIGSKIVLETLADPDGDPTIVETLVLGDVDVITPLDCSPVIAVPAFDLTIKQK